MTVQTLLKATDARFQSLKIGPLPSLITCRIRYHALFRDLSIYKLSTGLLY